MRKRFLYLRLALANLKKNRQTYLSFFLSTVCTIFVFYIFCMIALNGGIKKLRGASSMQVMMVLGAVVVAIFAFAFLFYANSFLIKRRKKELGLYAILGLEKKHIARILFHETVTLLIGSLVCGIGFGISLSRLMFLLVQALMRVPTPIVFQVTPLPLLLTCGLFAAVFLVLLIYNRLQVHLNSPVSLMRGQQRGEKEPKTRWLLALTGIAAMAAGYVIANSVDNPMKALAVFFIAVLLVIVGTYALFTAGSIAFLKLLRRNKSYYYKPRNFISVSGMIYRMKQNAAGLAGICILSTMAIITIGTTGALYIGQGDMLRDQNPTDQKLAIQEGILDPGQVETMIRNLASESQVDITDLSTAAYCRAFVLREGDVISQAGMESINSTEQYKKVWDLYILPVASYNAMVNGAYTLGDGQALLFQSRDVPDTAFLTVGDTTLQIKQNLTAFPVAHKGHTSLEPPMYLVLRDRETVAAVMKSLAGSEAEAYFMQAFWWNTQGSYEALSAFSQSLHTDLTRQLSAMLQENGGDGGYELSDINTIRQEWYAMYGGFLFLGVFLGLLFLMATTLIIYFKQVSEGYMDHDRFIILQKVGMARDEVKATVRKQILMVFILPIVAAILHTFGALHMMTEMLSMFGLGNTLLIALSIFTTAGVFALLYAMVYALTARTYYGMVRMDG